MIVKGKFDEYNVKYEQKGWSYAVPVVYQRKKIPLLPIYRWKRVWEGDSKPLLTASKLLPEPMQEWFTDTVSQYEEYQELWRNYNNGE